MKERTTLKAEDILAEENFSKETLLGSASSESQRREFQIARSIYNFLTSSSQNLFSENDKERTEKKIKLSVIRYKRNKIIKRWSIAAAVIVTFGLAELIYMHGGSTPEIVKFAETLKDVRPNDDTRLILRDKKEVLIDKSQSEISYSKNGQDITIGADQKVVQKITDKEADFNTVIVPYGKRTMITLSEGSKVWLNAGSKLVYPSVFAGDKREVYIEGEGIFEVAHNASKPFFVNTRDYGIRVIGTVFNVSAYSDDQYSSTTLEQGKIEINYKGKGLLAKEKMNLTPGTMAIYDPEEKSFSQQQVNPRNYMSWREGYLIFNHERLSNILRKLSRYYNVSVQLTDNHLGEETFSGNLDLKGSAPEVLNVIGRTIPIQYHYENEKLVLTPK